jgi:hypothetical protein
MKLFSLRLTTLKSKIYAIVFASFVVRVVAFFALPNTASSLAPDEGNYAALAEWIRDGQNPNEYINSNLYSISRTLIIPASYLTRIGFTGIDSVRAISSLYGLLTSVILGVYLYKVSGKSCELTKTNAVSQKIFFRLYIIFVFFPSNFLWSVLGLRDSALTFWVLLFFLLIANNKPLESKLSGTKVLIYLITILMIFTSRPQVGWLLTVVFSIYFFLISIKSHKLPAVIVFLTTVLGAYLGNSLTTNFLSENLRSFTVTTNNTLTSVPSDELSKYEAKCNYEGQQFIFEGKSVICREDTGDSSKQTVTDLGSAITDQATSLHRHHLLNQEGAASKIRTINCPLEEVSRIERTGCMIWRAPYTTYTFLFRPMLGVDVTSTSSFFAAIENIAWLTAAFYIVIMWIRNRRLAYFAILAPPVLFGTIYSVAAGAYEGNMGTAFRHKSLILWVVILLLASTIVASQQRKAEREGISGSSQE